jgi:hypothetical protein
MAGGRTGAAADLTRAGVSLADALRASQAMDSDRLIARLAQQGLVRVEPPIPSSHPKAEQFRRIGGKIEDQYASGRFDRAERWDDRLERWMERKDSHLHGMDEGPDVAGGFEDSATGISGQAADAYAEMLSGRLMPDDVPARVFHVAFGNLEGPMRRPEASDLMDFAKQMHAERMAHKARLSQPPAPGLPVLTTDDLIRRLGTQQP